MQRLSFRTLALLLSAFLAPLSACDTASDGGDGGGGSTADRTPPAVTSASSNGSTVTVRFNEAIDPASVTAAAFTVTPGPVAVSAATASGSSVTLGLASPLSNGQRVTYTVSATGVRDLAGNAASLSTSFTYGDAEPPPPPPARSSEIGAAYPNAGDSRIVFVSKDGDRFLRFNPISGAVSDADDLDDLENGLYPLDGVAAAANVFGERETYFFSPDGDTFTNYERDEADFDAPASFEEEYDEFGYDLNSIGAAVEGDFFASNSIVLFNQNGTRWQLWQPEIDAFSDVFTFPAQFGGGNAPIASVGAAFFRDDSNEMYLFDREGEQYTIWRGGSYFTAAFPISALGDIEF